MPQINSLFRFDSTDEPTSDSSMPEMATEFTWEDPLGATPLHHACFFSFVGEEKVKELLEGGADPNVRDKRGLTALHYLVLSAQAKIRSAQMLVWRGADSGLKDHSGKTPFECAVKVGNHPFMFFFLELGADFDELEGYDFNQLNKQGSSFFHQLCLSGSLEWIKEVLKRGGSLVAKTSQGENPLHLAVERGDQEVVSFLLDEGVEVNEVDQKGQTPLHLAVGTGKSSLIDRLVSGGANVDQQDSEGWTSLHCAAYRGSTEMVETLLTRWVDPSIKNKKGQTAFELALSEGKMEVVRLLKDRRGGLDKGFHQSRLREPAAKAILVEDEKMLSYFLDLIELLPEKFGKQASCSRKELCEWLFEAGPYFDREVHNKATWPDNTFLLHHAVFEKNHFLLRNVVYLGANLNQRDRKGESALRLASSQEIEDQEAMSFLLRVGADPDQQDASGHTLLMFLCMASENQPMLELLLEHGVEMDLQDSDGWTALHWATYRPHAELAFFRIDRLLKYGADPTIQDHQGRTPLDLLNPAFFPELAELFVKWEDSSKGAPSLTDLQGSECL